MTLSSDSPDRKTAILKATTRHFSTDGFEGASLRRIAADAGVSLTLLDHHFGSKGMLYDAVLAAAAGILGERLAALRRWAAESPPDGMQALVDTWIATTFASWSSADAVLLSQLAFLTESRRRCAALEAVLDETQREFGALVARVDPRWNAHASAVALTFVEEILHGEVRRGEPEAGGADRGERRKMLVVFVAGGLRELAEGLGRAACDRDAVPAPA